MAQVTEVRLVDDIDGGEAAETVAFGLEGKNYEIDLSEKRAAELRDVLASYVGAARRAAGSSTTRGRRTAEPSTKASVSREETGAIREWATANGFEVSTRGRIAGNVREAYENRGVAKPAVPVVEPPVIEAEVKPKRRARKKVTADA